MGYALAAQGIANLLVPEVNFDQAELASLSLDKIALATDKSDLNRENSLFTMQASKEKTAVYEKLKEDPEGNKDWADTELKLIDEELKAMTEELKIMLDEITLQETILDQQMQQVQTRLDAATQQLEAFKKMEEEGIKNSIPQYVA